MFRKEIKEKEMKTPFTNCACGMCVCVFVERKNGAHENIRNQFFLLSRFLFIPAKMKTKTKKLFRIVELRKKKKLFHPFARVILTM